jgi:glycosyltransferase involved in cell wall biosynthesis
VLTGAECILQGVFISVIVPVLNGENYIGGCIDSLLSQDYPRELYEIIIVDNGSVDGTVRVASGYESVKVLIKENVNVGAVRNVGSMVARGEVLAFIDCDCIADGAWLKEGAGCLRGETFGIVGAHYKVPIDCNWVGRVWGARDRYKGYEGEVAWIPGGNCFISKELFDVVGGFKEDLVSNEDVDLCHRVSLLGYSVFSYPKIVVYHLGENIGLSKFFKKEMWRGSEVVRLFVGDRRRSNMKGALFGLFYLFAIFMLLAGLSLELLFGRSYGVLLGSLGLLFLPPTVLAIQAIKRHRIYKYFLHTALLYFIVGVASAVAIVYPKRFYRD